MPDDGHDLRFGPFLSPDADRVHDTLELAQLADVTGLDLVTVQDHPHQARHVDATTLLIAAAGGERHSPGQAVDALVEAVRVIRGVWGQDPDRPDGGSVTDEGDHYRVTGLHAGPAPLHPVEIWLGAYQPRMLRVTGRLADGWLPSLAYADPGTLAASNAAIDEAADAAGRGPQAVRRLYHVSGAFGSGSDFLQGSPDDWAEQLAGLTLEHGMSTFILAADDPDDVRRLAEGVAPAVRELVATERAGRASAPDAAARARSAAATATGSVPVVPVGAEPPTCAGPSPPGAGARPGARGARARAPARSARLRLSVRRSPPIRARAPRRPRRRRRGGHRGCGS